MGCFIISNNFLIIATGLRRQTMRTSHHLFKFWISVLRIWRWFEFLRVCLWTLFFAKIWCLSINLMRSNVDETAWSGHKNVCSASSFFTATKVILGFKPKCQLLKKNLMSTIRAGSISWKMWKFLKEKKVNIIVT